MNTMQTINIPSPKAIHKNAVDHGWYDNLNLATLGPYFVPSSLALVHSEISEALQVYREHGIPTPGQYASSGEDSFSDELADAVIRILDMCGFLGIDIEDAINRKHMFNQTRPQRHGGKMV